MEKGYRRLANILGDELGLLAIDTYHVEDDERKYHESDFEHFQYVFNKDNMATYHQQFDNILHWIWNEYENDPIKYESLEYKTKICDKVFTTINARIYGILNPDDNHATIVSMLDSIVPDVNMFDYIATMHKKLYDRRTPFTKDDAIVWYTIDTPSISGDAMFARKPLPIPYILVNGKQIPIEHIQDFYLALFRYTIKWYNHLYSTKNEACWLPIDKNDYIFAIQSHKTLNDSFEYVHPDDDTSEIINLKNFHRIGDFNINIGNVIILNIASENGQFHDKTLQPFCFAYLARREDGYWISSQRGYDKWSVASKYNLEASHWEKQWVNTLAARNKNEEAILSEMWRDIMQCNAVLFHTDAHTTIELMITNWNDYGSDISKLLEDDIIAVENNVAYITISNILTLVKIWSILEHTLDLWVKFIDDNITKWSLICNIYQNKYEMYIDKPYIISELSSPTACFNDSDDVIAIIPRDGMTYYLDNSFYTFIPKEINGYQLRKSYL